VSDERERESIERISRLHHRGGKTSIAALLSGLTKTARNMFGNEKDPIRYPLSGFTYLLTHPKMWGLVIKMVFLGLLVSITALVLLFTMALKPQAEGMGNHWWSWVLACIFVVFESVFVAALVLHVVQSKSQKKIFVETMRQEGVWREGEMEEPSMLKDVNCFKLSVLVRVLTFPLNIIPLAGQVVYAYVNAPYAGWDCMDMYLDAIHMEYDDQKMLVFGSTNAHIFSPKIYKMTNPYTRFGFAAVLLETIPILGPSIFGVTNACAAALWAADMEKKGGPQGKSQEYVSAKA
jgi:hypothetical protein